MMAGCGPNFCEFHLTHEDNSTGSGESIFAIPIMLPRKLSFFFVIFIVLLNIHITDS